MTNKLPNFELAELKKFELNVLTDCTYSTPEELGFVIALSAVFNDMKDLFWTYQILVENKPENIEREISAYNGQYSGMGNFVLRHLIGLFWEFLVLIEKNQNCLKGESIVNAESRLTGDSQKYWNALKKLALTETFDLSEKEKKIVECLVQIRNTVSFHYYGIKNFNNGIQEYIATVKDKAAIYSSMGDNMEKTRFYYADAATQFSMLRLMKAKDTNEAEVVSFIKMMNHALRFLVESFIESQNTILNGNREERRYLVNKRGYK